MRLPNFLIIGAAKSGTTSLYEYLRQHPQVFMSALKEPRFFAFDGGKPDFGGPRGSLINRNTVYQYEKYVSLFNGVDREIAIGEASPHYLWISGTAKRIRTRIPEARLIAILRDPVERAFSAFSMNRREGFEPMPTLAEAIADEPRRIREQWGFCIYVERGYYGRQLEEYYECFPSSRIRVYLYEDLRADPIRLVRSIFDFLGVDSTFVPDLSKMHNVSGMIRNPVLRALWTRTHGFRSIIEPIVPKRLRTEVSGFFRNRSLVKLPFPEETRRQLRDLYRADIQKLQALIARDLSSWLA